MQQDPDLRIASQTAIECKNGRESKTGPSEKMDGTAA